MCAADMFGVVTPCCELLDTSVSEGNVDGERFLRWARTGLFPGLGNFELREARSIVVLDNCVLCVASVLIDALAWVRACLS